VKVRQAVTDDSPFDRRSIFRTAVNMKQEWEEQKKSRKAPTNLIIWQAEIDDGVVRTR